MKNDRIQAPPIGQVQKRQEAWAKVANGRLDVPGERGHMCGGQGGKVQLAIIQVESRYNHQATGHTGDRTMC